MSFDDERAEPHRLTATIWACERCGDRFTKPCASPRIYVREAVERGGNALLHAHDCDDGAVGVARLIGAGPGRPLGEVLAGRRAEVQP